jgi:CBS domain-containing protein
MEITQLVHLLVEQDIPGVLVVDDGRLIGVVTERDCIDVALQAGYFDERGGTVAEFMTTSVETLDPDDSLMDVAERMTKAPYRRFPVVEDGRLVGLLTRRDVLRALGGASWFRGGGVPR